MALRIPTKNGTWLERWNPEDPQLWEAAGKAIAWRTLWITTYNLTLSFIVWFMVSAIVVKLPGVGFKFTTTQLFWLTAMPGLAGGTLRIIWTFLPPILGTRHLVTISTALLLIPVLGWSYAIQNPSTPYWVLLLLAFLAGIGGGNFSGFMPSTSYFFPKRLQGTALGIQAGIGNFGVSVVQFLTPWVVGFALFASGILRLDDPQSFSAANGLSSPIWLHNAALVWTLFILIGVALAWTYLKSVPVRANFREQFDIFRDKHTWIMTSLYIATFGSFSGFSAVFALLIRQLYGKFEGAPDPLAFAFLGPLVGSALRVIFGPLADRFGGARLTQVSTLGMLLSAIGLSFYVNPVSLSQFPYFVGFMLALFFFAGIGNASTFKQMPMIFDPRRAGGVIGWTAAVAAYGPFIFSTLIAAIIARTGHPTAFFYGVAVFYALNAGLNWYFYARKGAEKPC
ncbi:MFS transporter [Calidithermus roseus]|uniref:Nitrate/nitrite transporter NarK n=1 Tax=Calidithermus roseus TaxID=1644118 RepID=A0A399EPP8_9DEIN|nr:MFS transporter [Calidithermus roseus]RIH85513.1 Nitrate/nitrite transporter NarK [Calidithermus roseus]